MTRIRGGIRLCAVLAALCSGLSLFATLSNSVYMDCREVCIVAGKTYVAPSSGNPSARPQVDGGTAGGWRTEDPRWDSDSVEDGWHTLSIEGEDATPRVLCLNGDGIAVHAGVISGSEVWGAGKVHVVRGWVRIEKGAQLTVERGAIVKFSQGTGMRVDGTLLGDGAVFTALADDSAGGDTDCNGTGGQFSTYAITGDGAISLQEAVVRYMSPPADWKAPEGMQNSMSLSLVVRRADGTRIESYGSVVGVFDRRGGCRGVASLRTTAWGAKVYQGQVFSNEASERGWSIKVWNTGEGMARSIAETVDFIQDDAWGTAREPREVHAAHRVFLDGVDKGWYDYLQEVTIAAPVPRRKVFDTWAADGMEVPYEMQSVNPLVFTMPDNEVRLYSSFMYPNFLAWTLKKGWNWVSVNLEPNADISYVLREYAPADGDQVKTSDSFSTYYARHECWDPEIPIVAGRMYAFYHKNDNTVTVKIRGDLLDGDNDIPLARGWNWIGCFTDADFIRREELVHNGGFSDGDQLKGHGGADFADYYAFDDWQGWDGELAGMTAGKGYKLKVKKAGMLSVAAPGTRGTTTRMAATRAGRSADAGTSGPWTPPKGYAYSMTLEAEVRDTSGWRQTAPGSVVGIFDAQGNCRGIASLRTTKWDTKVYGGQVMSDDVKETGLALRFWDAASGNVRTIQETIDFVQDTSYGTALEPRKFTVTKTAPQKSYRLTVNGETTDGYCAGDAIRVGAPAIPAGQRFLRWTTEGVNLDDATSPVQYFVMPAGDVTLTASWTALGFQPPEGWTLPDGDARHMTVFGMVRLLSDKWADEEASQVAAFDESGVCRGIGVPDAYMSRRLGRSVYLLQVANDGWPETLSLKFWSQSEGKVHDLEEGLEVSAGAVVGDERPLSWNVVRVEPNWIFATMSLAPGWNLVTPRLRLSEESVQALSEYVPMVLDGNRFAQASLEEIPPGCGVWLYNASQETRELKIKGEDVEDWQLEVAPGWQFIGALKEVPPWKMPANVEIIMEWTPEDGYRQVKGLEPGFTYWIKGRRK